MRAGSSLAWCGAALAAACTTTTAPIVDGAGAVRALAVFCVEGKNYADAANCKTDSQLFALVGGGSKGNVALAAPNANLWVDNDKAVPGATPLRLSGEPVALAVDAPGKRAYAVVGDDNPSLVRIDLTGAGHAPLRVELTVPLPFAPADIALVERSDAGGALLPRYVAIADPAGAQIWLTPLQDLSVLPQWTRWPVGGSPVSLQWLPGRHQLWVGHLHHGYVSVIDVETGLLLGAPTSVDNACRNGLDDDGDGLTDRADRGCDGPTDDNEMDPEVAALCGNGLDDDGDGATDAADPGCAAVAVAAGIGVADGCRNGLDDDGDGTTDFPADPGCADYADTSEASDNPGCANGRDDDGDGLTDASDPQCASGQPVEWPLSAAALGLPVAPSPACANGLDDDGDGSVDLQDADCWSRSGSAEVGPDRTPAMRLGATADERYIAVTHQGRREVLFIDVATQKLLRPVHGEKTPFARASRLDERDGVLGLAVAARPTALVGMPRATGQQMGIGVSPGGLVVASVQATETTAPAIQWVVSTTTTATTISKPGLIVAGTAVDLGAAVPTRFASLGPFRTEVRATGTAYYGVQPNAESFEHRTEQWRAVFEGLLPGGVRTTGRFVAPQWLHDGAADFCAMGVLPGDWLIVAASAACKTDAIAVRVSAVYGDTLSFDAATAKLDSAVTDETGQLAVDLAVAATVAFAAVPIDSACYRDGAVAYSIRASGWLLTGSRSGLLSARPRKDGACADLPANELFGARLPEPQLRLTNGAPQRPATCPYANGLLDPAFVPTPVDTAVFSGLQIQPGCKTTTLPSGQIAVKVLRSMREATWVFNVSAGYQPLLTGIGAQTVGLAAGPHLQYVYGLDAGAGALLTVDPVAATTIGRLE